VRVEYSIELLVKHEDIETARMANSYYKLPSLYPAPIHSIIVTSVSYHTSLQLQHACELIEETHSCIDMSDQ